VKSNQVKGGFNVIIHDAWRNQSQGRDMYRDDMHYEEMQYGDKDGIVVMMHNHGVIIGCFYTLYAFLMQIFFFPFTWSNKVIKMHLSFF